MLPCLPAFASLIYVERLLLHVQTSVGSSLRYPHSVNDRRGYHSLGKYAALDGRTTNRSIRSTTSRSPSRTRSTPSPPLVLQESTPTDDDLVQRRPTDRSVRNIQFPEFAPREQRGVEFGDPLFPGVRQDQVRAPDALALPPQMLSEGGAHEAIRAGIDALGIHGDRLPVDVEFDASFHIVERGGADDGGSGVIVGLGLINGYVGRRAEDAAGILVNGV